MTPEDVLQLTLVAAAGVLAPLIVAGLRRFAIPSVVLEITFGIILGPQVLNLVQPTGLVDGLSVLGLSMLMFLAGYELKLDTIRGRPLTLAGISWGLSVVLAAVVGFGVYLSGGQSNEIVIPLALTTTALGTLLPVLRDAGVLGTPLGRYAMALGSVGEFGPIVLVGLLLTGTDPVQSIVVLVAFAVLILGSAFLANRPWGERIVSFIAKGLWASSQLPVRITLLFMLALAAIANTLGIDVLLVPSPPAWSCGSRRASTTRRGGRGRRVVDLRFQAGGHRLRDAGPDLLRRERHADRPQGTRSASRHPRWSSQGSCSSWSSSGRSPPSWSTAEASNVGSGERWR